MGKLNAQKIDYKLYSKALDPRYYNLSKGLNNNPILISHEHYINLRTFERFEFKLKTDYNYNKLDLSSLTSVNVNSKIYLVSGDGSTVYEFNKETGLNQLNFPTTKRKYYYSSVFSFNGKIYRLGGYGFWNHSSEIFSYNFQTNRWDFIINILDNGYGFLNQYVQVKNNKLYIISPRIKNNFRDLAQDNDFIFILDLLDFSLDKYKFDFKAYPRYFKDLFFTSLNYFSSKKGIGFISEYDSKLAAIFDFENRSFYEVYFNSSISNDRKVIYSDDTLYYLRPNAYNGISQKFNPFRLAKTFPVNTYPKKKFNIHPDDKILFIVIVFAFFVILIPLIFVIRSVDFILNGNILKRGKTTIKLDPDELYFLKYLVKNGQIDNQTLISHFDTDNKSYDLNVKRKNEMISKLSLKISSNFKKEFFIKAPSNTDKRQSVYILTQRLKLGSK